MGNRSLILLAAVLMTGCASTRSDLFLEYIEVTNPQTICGQAMCVQKASYRGEPLCKVIVGPDADKGKVGALLRECVKAAA